MLRSPPVKLFSILPWHQAIWARWQQQVANHQMPHALLICGLAGVGKFHLAHNLAELMLCQRPACGEPCGACHGCVLLQAGNHPDYEVVQPEEKGAGIKIDQIRNLIPRLANTAHQGGSRVTIIREAGSLNLAAANALLKTLEEPSPNNLIILLAAQATAVLPTIRSRCQIIEIAPVWDLATQHWLEQQLPPGDWSAETLLRQAEGAPLRALASIKDDGWVRREKLWEELINLADGKSDWTPLIDHCGAWSNGSWSEAWLALVDDLIRLSFSREGGAVDQEGLGKLNQLVKRMELDALWRYRDQIIEIRRMERQGLKFNQRLAVENLIVNWRRLAGSQAN